jgi:fibronectin-binding autotransporter adhesin
MMQYEFARLAPASERAPARLYARAAMLRTMWRGSVAAAALLAGAAAATADDLSFTWNGAGNGTSFGNSSNWAPNLDLEDNLIPGPPSGYDDMVVTMGTPTFTSTNRVVRSATISGGEFLIRSSKFGVATFKFENLLNVTGDGSVQVTREEAFGASVLTANQVEISGGRIHGGGILVVKDTMTQTGGVVSINVEMPGYDITEGPWGQDFVAHVPGVYTHSGGQFGGTLTTSTYALTGAGATSQGGAITATDVFDLKPAEGTALVAASLSGSGGLRKSGNGTVVLSGSNDFTGGVIIETGTLELRNGSAIADTASVDVGAEGTLAVTDSETIGTLTGLGHIEIAGASVLTTGGAQDSTFGGTMGGAIAGLTKTGAGRLTLAGDASLGKLSIEAGTLAIGTGTTANTVIFDAATIAANATLYVATGATLTITLADGITNNGFLVNDGTINDDLYNANTFDNYSLFNANVSANTGAISNNLPDGAWVGDVLNNKGFIANNGATWTGDIVGNTEDNGPYAYNGLIYNRGGTWTGDIIGNDGQVWNDNFPDETGHGYWFGDVVSNNKVVFNGGGGIWDGDVLANAGQVKNDAGGVWIGAVASNDRVLENYGQWTGNVLTNKGSIYNGANGYGTWTGNVLGNQGRIINEWVWDGDIVSSGTVSARHQINGDFDNSGTLRVTGALGGIGALTNTGVLDMTTAGTGQTISVASATFGGASSFKLDVDAAGGNDSMAVTGLATLAGTVRVSAGGSGTFDDQTIYTIMTAGSISGDFAAVTTNLSFLAPELSRDGQAVYLTLMRNDVGLGDVGETANQRAAGTAVELLEAGNSLYDAALWLEGEEATAAFDALSGEFHRSLDAIAMANANIIADIATGRLDQIHAALGSGSGAASAYADSGARGQPEAEKALWAQFYGQRSFYEATEETSGLEANIGGIAVGLDGEMAGLKLGMLVHGGVTRAEAEALGSSSVATDYGAAVYGGAEIGQTRLSFGGAYARHDIDSTRVVAFPGVDETLTAAYSAGTAQAFARVSHSIDLGATAFAPYAGVGYVAYATDGFSETGGDAAIDVEAHASTSATATLGLGVEHKMLVAGAMVLTASGSVGWQHTAGEQSAALHAFAGEPGFAVIGSPMGGDMAIFGAGLNLDVDAATRLDLDYDGRIGAGGQAHSLKGTFATRF